MLRSAPVLVALLLFTACDDGDPPGNDAGVFPAEDSGTDPPPSAVTLSNLVDRLIDPVRLAQMPRPFHRTLQASSYDRRAQTPGNDDWFSNEDWASAIRPGFIREEQRDGRTEYVMLDATGPGAMVRIWSASPAGTMRVYLDDDPEPVLVEDMDALTRGRVAPFEDPFAYTVARGANFYFPIPYQSRCVITTDTYPGPEFGGNLYYHFNTIRFVDGTEVEPFSNEAFESARTSIEQARRVMADPSELDDLIAARPGLEEVDLDVSTMGGDPLTIMAGADGTMIRRIDLVPSDLSEEALRATLLVMEFDGRETVRVPLGDFFGGGPGVVVHESLITEVSADGRMTARWALPFMTSASISIEGEMEVSVAGTVSYEPRAADAGELLYFHAGWRQNDARSTRPYYDWTIADLQGRGQYVGTILNITNDRQIWWGEGDEKIYVDGESFPGYFGTGTEDYFGYAHTDTGYFSVAFHGQPVVPVGPGNYGRTSNFRWHLLDPIPFRESFRFDQEVWHWEETDMPLDVVTIWYATSSTTHDDVPPTPGELVVPPL